MLFQEVPLNLLKSDKKLKIVRFLLNYEASMSEREIASVVKVSHMSVNRIMQEFSQMNLVYYVSVGKAHLWKVNRKSFVYKVLVQFFTSLQDMPDPLKELKRMILKHLPKVLIKKVVLFGSVAKNNAKFDSDIDLFILVGNLKSQVRLEDSIERLSMECLDVFGNRLSPYILTEKQFKQKQKLSIISEISKGIQIYSKRK